MENAIRVIDPGDPRRCQGNNKFGQCTLTATPNGTYCKMHGGANQEVAAKKKEANQYRLDKWQSRVEQFREHADIKSLRDEIGIARMMLEETLNKCQDSNDLQQYSAKVTQLLMVIKELIQSCHKIEISTGAMLDRSQVVNIANIIITSVGARISDPDVMEAITSEILIGIENASALGSVEKQTANRSAS